MRTLSFILFILIGLALFNAVYPSFFANLSKFPTLLFNNDSNSSNDMFVAVNGSLNNISNFITQTHRIELRSGRIVECREINQSDCGISLSKCYNNAAYPCRNDTRILV